MIRSNMWRSILAALALPMVSACAVESAAQDETVAVESEPGRPELSPTKDEENDRDLGSMEARPSAVPAATPMRQAAPTPEAPCNGCGPRPEPWTEQRD
ncbi:MAG: hypothetical protein K0S65_6010 [Labilithrix sp.]|jgi:hypothetical protein|nr:hypothetical protein [Labilithrix sp.]